MRRPTPLHDQLAWWAAALAGQKPPIHDSDPRPGFYERRLVKGGPMVPARIWLVQVLDEETGELAADEVFCCEVGGRRADAADQWSYLAAHPISEADFNHMRARTRWAEAHRGDHPIANPHAPVDWDRAPVPF